MAFDQAVGEGNRGEADTGWTKATVVNVKLAATDAAPGLDFVPTAFSTFDEPCAIINIISPNNVFGGRFLTKYYKLPPERTNVVEHVGPSDHFLINL